MDQSTPVGSGLLGRDRFVETSRGRHLRAMIAGDGDDLVVLESGLGLSGLSWGPVHAALARRTRVVAYERAGFGASSPAPSEPRDLAGLAADLKAVVAAFPRRRLSGQQQGRFGRDTRAQLIAAHRSTTNEHPGARFVAAEGSGHMIPVTEPKLIADEALRHLPREEQR